MKIKSKNIMNDRPDLTIIGERINPGFRSSKALFDHRDIDGIQALAARQADAGASYLNVNIGTLALNDKAFMVDAIKGIQDVVDIPLSFDFPSFEVQELCLNNYDEKKANGEKPIINSISEHRADMMEALKVRPSKVIIMASERLEDGAGKPNKTARQVHEVTHRLTEKLVSQYGLGSDDVIADVSISTLASDIEGLTQMALDGIKLIGTDPDLSGIHMMGGISNIGMMLPNKTVHGTTLGNGIERAFLTIARPLGFDTILGTPWHNYDALPEDDFILNVFKDVIGLRGTDALRELRKLYAA